jgi:hypothetical protein
MSKQELEEIKLLLFVLVIIMTSYFGACNE